MNTLYPTKTSRPGLHVLLHRTTAQELVHKKKKKEGGGGRGEQDEDIMCSQSGSQIKTYIRTWKS